MPRRKDGTGITTTLVKAGINPHNTNPLGATRTKGTKTPKGAITTNAKGRNNVKTIFPCALCGEFGHYTHHFPQIADFKWLKDLGSLPHSPAQPAPQQAPQQYVQQPPPVVLQNPIPHQGVINTQQDMQHPPPQVGQYHNPNNPAERTILLTSEEEILLQTRNCQYHTPAESTPISPETNPTPTWDPRW
jgi:hypothetical protein